MINYPSAFIRIPFEDRVYHLFYAWKAESARLHKDKVAVLRFRTEFMADALYRWILQFNNIAGLAFIRATKCEQHVALIDINKIKGDYIWTYK